MAQCKGGRQSPREGAALGGWDELPVWGGRCEWALGSLVREPADETPAVAGKLGASSPRSVGAVAATEGPERDMPQPTQMGRFEPRVPPPTHTAWAVAMCRLACPAGNREAPSLGNWREMCLPGSWNWRQGLDVGAVRARTKQATP